MRHLKRSLPLLLTLLVWAACSWPLPRYVGSGIPSSDRNVEYRHVRDMIPGDHLQLLYHFWLAREMIGGQTPLFHNLYEFNTGDDNARYQPDAYYLPFSFIYAMVSAVGGHAWGWNMAQLLSLLIGVWTTFLLVRRYTPRLPVAILATAIAATFPYRWIALLTGSPTGFAMGLVPLILLGLDIAVRDRRVRGGLLAGIGILMAYGSDLHVFYFSALLMPAWCVLAWCARDADLIPSWRELRRTALALLPTLLLALAALAISRLISAQLEGTDMAAGRTDAEVAAYSPLPIGLISWRNIGMGNHVFTGIAFLLLLLLAWGYGLLAGHTPPRGIPTDTGSAIRRPRLLLLLLGLGIGVVICLALGMNGPGQGAALRACRTWVPNYRMIRQTVKVYSLLPTLAAVLIALGFSALTRRGAGRGAWLMGLLCGVVLIESRCQISPTICRIPADQGAYRAVAEDAAAGERDPHVLILPLWPGDSHWSSIYQYYVTLHRTRMINGYSPAKRDDYVAEVFERLESANQGVLEDDQLALLQGMGIDWIILHEDAFPEKVSPFPVGMTLARLLTHPRLAPLGREGAVWSFRILDAPRPPPAELPDWARAWPARRWEAERCLPPNAPTDAILADNDASSGACLCLARASAAFDLRSPVVMTPRMAWAIRVRGPGHITTDLRADANTPPVTREIELHAADWVWTLIPAEPLLETDRFLQPSLKLRATEGTPRLDVGLLTDLSWRPPEPGETLTLPAAAFFHAGHTDPGSGAVQLLSMRDPDLGILYGPMLPLPAGHYRISLAFDSDAPDGTPLGRLELGYLNAIQGRAPVVAGEPCATPLLLPDDRPFLARFVYSRRGDVQIRALQIERESGEE